MRQQRGWSWSSKRSSWWLFEEWHVSAQDSSDEEDTIHTDLMGADEEENIDNTSTQKKEKEDDRRMWRHKRKN
jgi:hypothetical protein